MATTIQSFFDKVLNKTSLASAATNFSQAYFPQANSTNNSPTNPSAVDRSSTSPSSRRESIKTSASSTSLKVVDSSSAAMPATSLLAAAFSPRSTASTACARSRSNSRGVVAADILQHHPHFHHHHHVGVVANKDRRSPSSASLKDFNNNTTTTTSALASPIVTSHQTPVTSAHQTFPNLDSTRMDTSECHQPQQQTSSLTSSFNPFIDLHELKNKLLNFSITFLDCRTANDFQSRHINNSVHVNCRDKLTRKRLLTRRTTVKDLISCKETRTQLTSDDDGANSGPPAVVPEENFSCLASPTTVSISELPQQEASAAAECDAAPNDENRHPTHQSSSKYLQHQHHAALLRSTSLKEKKRNMIVLYDDKTSEFNELMCESNPLKIVQDNIKQSGLKKECKILKGGFQSFLQMFPEMCVIKSAESGDTSAALKYAAYYHCNNQSQSAIDNAVMTRILPHLYLGNEVDAKNVQELEKEGIYYILNVTKNIPMPVCPKFKVMRISVNDCSGSNLKQHFDEAFEFIDEAKVNNSKVLVHCQAGVSRSPTIVIAYLMSRMHLPMNDAMDLVRKSRPIIEPNLVFINQLQEFEAKLGTKSNSNNSCSSSVEEGQVKLTLNNTSNNSSSNSCLLKTLLHSTSSFFSEHFIDDKNNTTNNTSRSSGSSSKNTNETTNSEPATSSSSSSTVPQVPLLAL